jgi:tRNA(Ile)-lysidine synthase
VAWSGGADSTALLICMHELGLAPRAWHVDHGWHADSSAQANLLRCKAEAWRIPFFCTRISASGKSNREALARQARYAAFEQWAAEQGVSLLCLGHHADDQAETVFLRLLQGSGVIGLQGMAESRQAGSLQLLRPLLGVPRHEIEQALNRAGVDWLEDSSNADQSLLRNRIRHRDFPAMRRAGFEPREWFARLARQAGRVADQLQPRVDEVAVRKSMDGVAVDWIVWSALSSPVRALLLQRMVVSLFGEGRVLGRRHLLLVERWTGQGGRGGLDLSRCRLARRKSEVRLTVAANNPDNTTSQPEDALPLQVQ